MHWQESLWDNLKPSFDYACAEGLNRLVWHAFTCSPDSTGTPGQQYFAGTHLDPKNTWWSRSAPFFSYINRCQWMLSRGLFVADAVYYYGDHVPNFTQLRSSDPARLGPGYDYDVITEEALIERLTVKEGRLVLPDGMSYALLVLPERNAISLPALRKIQELVRAGASILGPEPEQTATLSGYPAADAEVKKIAESLWPSSPSKGHVYTRQKGYEVFQTMGLKPDFDYQPTQVGTVLTYLHRREGDCEIYFISSRDRNFATATCNFRVSGKAPELWDAVSGRRVFADTYTEAGGTTSIPLQFPPNGSLFVVFQKPSAIHPSSGKSNYPEYRKIADVPSPWTLHFDPKWGGPGSIDFPDLQSWTENASSGIKYYSGTVTYRNTFRISADTIKGSLFLDLGEVRELAEVRLNGKALGIVWAPPFRIDISTAVQPGENHLEIDVVNFWCNRVIGDEGLPEVNRLTRTNIRQLTGKTPLLPSGLLGPVQRLQSSTAK
jgi:hypothetical protein